MGSLREDRILVEVAVSTTETVPALREDRLYVEVAAQSNASLREDLIYVEVAVGNPDPVAVPTDRRRLMALRRHPGQ